jgi:hypothetical protein
MAKYYHKATTEIRDERRAQARKTVEEVCWLLRTSVRKKDGFALVFFIFLAALVLF